jgi:hypothetical protein
MTDTAYFANDDADLWLYQPPINEQHNFSNNSYPTEQQHVYTDPNYNQNGSDQNSSNQNSSASTSLLETLLRQGKNTADQDYVNPSGNPGAPLGGQNMSNISCQSAPYTPTSSTDRTSPIVDFVPNARERVQPQQIQNRYLLNYHAYPTQQYSNSYVTPSMMVASNSPINYGAQRGYVAYANDQVNETRNPNETNKFADEQARQQVEYPWMKSSSNGL